MTIERGCQFHLSGFLRRAGREGRLPKTFVWSILQGEQGKGREA